MRAESITFNGIEFRRYPESRRWADRVYYTPGGTHRTQGVGRLHEEVWKAAHGAIPAGHCIHHRDGNPLNNALDNLACVPREEHHRHHSDAHRGVLDPTRLASLEKARPLAAQWHRSAAGRRWHSALGKQSWQGREPLERVCAQCGRSFGTMARRESDRFCSNACKSAWRRQSGVDNETRTCAWCGKEFVANRYDKKRFCTRSCSGHACHADARAGL